MPKKQISPSAKNVEIARQTRLYQEYDISGYLEIKLVRGDRVELRFGGYEIDFKYDYTTGQVTRCAGNYRYFNNNDFQFLFRLASDLMKAAIRGYKEKSKERSKRKKDKEAYELLSSPQRTLPL